MAKEIRLFLIKLISLSLLLFLVHSCILVQLFPGELYFPLWSIYTFNAVLVFTIYITVRYYSGKELQSTFKIFMGLSALKMLLAILFLLPLFLGKSDRPQTEIFNFFIPYFLLLILEITGLTKFLQKS